MTETSLLFPAIVPPMIAIRGEPRCYPVHRIFCVGRNYAEHAREMGSEVDREAPWYFTKPATAIVLAGAAIPYPPETNNYHYEMELVVAIGQAAFRIPVERALDAVYGYACGLDMTRRDLQMAAREKQRPWDLGKAFEQSAIIANITPAPKLGVIGPQRISLKVDGKIKQQASLSDLVWSVPELVSHLARFYHLGPGDLIYTGTPSGVGPVRPGEKILGEIEGLDPVTLEIGPPE